MIDFEEHVHDYNLRAEGEQLGLRARDRLEEARAELREEEARTESFEALRGKAKLILTATMRDVAKDMAKTVTRLIIIEALRKAYEEGALGGAAGGVVRGNVPVALHPGELEDPFTEGEEEVESGDENAGTPGGDNALPDGGAPEIRKDDLGP